MIKVTDLTKSFDGFSVLKDLNLNVKTGSIYGLVGTNGSGKTTLLQHLTGVLRPDSGLVTIDGEPVYDNAFIKQRTCWVPDDLQFYGSYTLWEIAGFFRSLYPHWSQMRFEEMNALLQLDVKGKISRFSKGMQKQAACLLNLCACPDYLLLDEPIDGLDPLVRKRVWQSILEDVADRAMTVLVSSHNLKDLDGICDSVGILSGGKIVLEQDLDELKSNIHKIQVGFREPSCENPYSGLFLLHRENHGNIDLLIARGQREQLEAQLRSMDPILLDIAPLSLEEIFIYELGGEADEIQELLF